MLPTLCLDRLSEMSRTVSDAAQKYGDDSLHPIWRLLGMNIFVLFLSLSGVNLVRMYMKLHALSGATLSLHQPYLM